MAGVGGKTCGFHPSSQKTGGNTVVKTVFSPWSDSGAFFHYNIIRACIL